MAKVHENILEKILKALDEGHVPWIRPWNAKFDFNAISKKEYRGINQILLSLTGRGSGWMTPKQAIQLGGDFKGVKTEWVTFYARVKGKKKSGEENEPEYWLLRQYFVLPVKEIKGLPEKYYKMLEVETVEHEPVTEAEAIISAYLGRTGVMMHFGGSKACYCPMTDEIYIPDRNTFKSIEEYYGTVFHELIHSTKKRVGIKDTYAGEELRAEMGSAMLLAKVGLDANAVIQNSAAYCNGWAEQIRGENVTLITSAASKAVSGVDLILEGAEVFEEV